MTMITNSSSVPGDPLEIPLWKAFFAKGGDVVLHADSAARTLHIVERGAVDLAKVPPDGEHEHGDEGGKERGNDRGVAAKGPERALFDQPYVLGGAGANIQKAGVVGNGEQYAFSYQRQVGRAEDGPVARVEQQAKGAAAYQCGDHPVARQEHDRVHDERPGYHGGGEDEADGVVRPPVETPIVDLQACKLGTGRRFTTS